LGWPIALLAERLASVAGQDDPLDHYVEAHVHGPVLLAQDVEAIVLDPSYRNTEVEALALTHCPVASNGMPDFARMRIN
jgi:hypothetical protein